MAAMARKKSRSFYRYLADILQSFNLQPIWIEIINYLQRIVFKFNY
jgi:hypothetical protein